MKEEMQSQFQGLSYEDEFDPGEVPYTDVRKRIIDTNVILSEISLEKRRNIFGESGIFTHFYF